MTVRTRRLARWYRERLVTQRDQLDPTEQTVEAPEESAKETVQDAAPEATLPAG